MQIELIRHAKVDFTWKRFYRKEAYEAACKKYDISKINRSEKREYDLQDKKLFISKLPRTEETARHLFGENIQVERNKLFNEVPMNPFCKRNYYLPCVLYNLIGRLQWYFNSSIQSERKKDTIKRANKAVDLLEKQKCDCVVVTHGFYMRTLVNVLKQRGYVLISRKSYHNLDKITLNKGCK